MIWSQVWPGNLLSENEQDTISRVSLPKSSGDPPKERSSIRVCRNGAFRVIRSLVDEELTLPPSCFVFFSQAVERRRDREAALALFNEAVQLAPENALVRYRRAKILISMRKYHVSHNDLNFMFDPDFVIPQPAVEDLEFLRNATPEESNVIFQLAKVYRLLGNVVKSAQTLAAARDIAPKSMNKIKKLLDTGKDDEDDMMDEG